MTPPPPHSTGASPASATSPKSFNEAASPRRVLLGVSFPILTRQTRVPWSWVVLMSVPWGYTQYVEHISTTAMTFKLRVFVDLPLLITLVGSFNHVFNILIGATANYVSDRIWTRHGRRRPLIMFGYLVVAIGLLVIPGINTLGALIVVIFVYEMLRDIGSPYEALCYEVVPTQQRGRLVSIFFWFRHLSNAFFFSVMIANWDSSWVMPWGQSVTGEQLVFWTGSMLAVSMFFFLWRGVRELPPAEMPPPVPRFQWAAVGAFIRNVFGDRRWLPLYAIAVAQSLFWGGMGNLGPLLFTEQIGYSKQQFGYLMAAATPLTLLLFMPIGGWLSDRVDRARVFPFFILAFAMCQVGVFVWFRFLTPGVPPALWMMVVVGLIPAGFQTIGTVICVPLIYDYVPRDYMGTVNAGVQLTRGIANVLIANGAGLWVTVYSGVFGRIQGKYDYTSVYLYCIVCLLISAVLVLWFSKQVAAGHIKKLGTEESEENQASASG